jgi:medium-chain acyl-[acyl-carrier-protein] hydrolase
MPLQPIWNESTTIKPYETDFQGRWKPHCFFQAMQTAATNHATHLGLGYHAMMARDTVWLLARLKLKILRNPIMGEQIRVQTWPRGLQQKIFFIRDFFLFDEQDQKVAAATSAWLLVDAVKRRILKPDPVTLAGLPDNRGRLALDETLDKIQLPEEMAEQFRVRAGYADIDLMQHVNNTRYIEWASDCFDLETHRSRQLESIQINYAHEVKPGEEVSVRIGQGNGDTRVITGENQSTGTRSFEVVWHWSSKVDKELD